MLNIVVSLVETAKSEQRVRAIRDKAARNKVMKKLQDTLLDLVSNAGDDILENRALKETLDESAITKVEISTALGEIKSILDNMKTTFNMFLPVAKRVSNLFFVLTDLVNVNPMYQYSLEFFRNIYKVTIKGGEKVEPKLRGKAQTAYFIKEFTSNLYRNVSRSLFVKDKLLFSFLTCLAIMREVQETTGGLDERALRFLMTGGTKVTLDKPNPAGEDKDNWLSDKMWASFEQMTE
jgi:dynein heavy chain